MRRRITYGMEEVFVGSTGGFNEARNTGQYISRLDFIQSYDFSFNVERQPNKQIGSDFYALRASQLAPDVNLNVSYLLNDGWNERYIGLDVSTDGTYKNPLQSVFASQTTGDRNFYILVSSEEGVDVNGVTSVEGYNVLSIGNSFITNYEISLSVNGLASVGCSFVGSNAMVNAYSNSVNWLPSVGETGQTAETANKKFGFVIKDIDNNYDKYVDDYADLTNEWLNTYPKMSKFDYGKYHYTTFGQGEGRTMTTLSRADRYMNRFKTVFDSGCHYGRTVISASPVATSGLRLGLDFNNFQNLQINIPLERKALYGFGSNYPTTRMIQKPVIATMSLDSIVSGFSLENLANTFTAEDVTISGYNFDIMFKNSRGSEKLGIKIQNAKLDSYNIGSQIGSLTSIKTNWSFEVNGSTGILMSGSCRIPTQSAIYINESINS